MSIIYLGKATPASGQGGGGSGEAVWGEITGTLADQTDLATALANKQDVLTAGTGIDITNNVISATGGGSTTATSVENKNTAVGATNPLNFWEGTEAEYNNGGSVTFYNWQSGGAQEITTDISFTPSAVAYGNGKYIAVGSSGLIYSSSDRLNWTAETSGVSVSLNGIAYGNNKFIATGNNGTIISSSGDGTWTTETSGTTDNLRTIVFGNNLFMVAPMSTNTNTLWYSSGDGTWNSVSQNTNNNLVFCDNKFFTVYKTGNGSSGQVAHLMATTNGSSWSEVKTWNLWSMSDTGTICGANNMLFYREYTSHTQEYTTDGGTTWNTYTTYPVQMVYGDGLYFGTNGISEDALTWTSVTNISSSAYAYGDAGFIGVGSNSGVMRNVLYSDALYVYTTDENPTTASTVYSAVSTPSALTITSVGTGTITCSDTNTYTYNASGNQIVTQNVGESHPNWICMIEGVGIKKGTTVIASATTVDQTYDATSANAQSGVAVASGISDTLGTIETALAGV